MAELGGFILFLTVALGGFWCLTFVALFIPYWLIFGSLERFGIINKGVSASRETL